MAIRTISVALLQLAAHDRHNFSQVWPRVLEAVVAAASKKINVIVLPEVTIPGYVLGFDGLDHAEIGRSLTELQSVVDAFTCVIVVGSAQPSSEHDDNGPHGMRNVAVVLTPRAAPQFSAKRFLWHFDAKWFDAGEDIAPVDTPFGKLGIIICADGRIPTLARTLVDRGAELLVVVTAWITSGRDPQMLENVQADLLARVRAWENATPLIAANKAGCELESVLYCGKSQIVDAHGNVVVLASQYIAETVVGAVEIGGSPRERTRQQLLLPPIRKTPRRSRLAATHALTEQQYKTAAWCDVETVMCTSSSTVPDGLPVVAELGGTTQAAIKPFGDCDAVIVFGDTVSDPAYLVPARQAGYDLFVWYPQSVDSSWIIPIARARSIELRCYFVVFGPVQRIVVVDPLGTIIAGSTETLHMPQFVYDPGVTHATTIAPHTDILDGLSAIEKIRNA